MAKTHFSPPIIRSFYHDVEQPILETWKKNRIFEKSIEQRPEKNHFVFYDGPPFVTGLPHYGHLLASVLKDIVPRYHTMRGKRVERVWGWDCHGIPVEEKVERQFNTKNRRDIENKVGIQAFIDACETYVSDVSGEWEWYIDRIARWVDMSKPYRTMDLNYMESVIWVFKQFYEKELVYKGKRVSLYCTRCGTPLSNFEIAMDNSYRELEDPSVFVKFPVNYYKTGVGAGVVVENEKGEILMIRRIKEGRAQVMGIVGGKYEDVDEKNLENTVRREVKEEIDCEVTELTYYGFNIDIFEGRLFKTHHFKVKVSGTPRVVDTEGDMDSELNWVKPEDIPWDNIHIPTKNTLKDVLSQEPRQIPHGEPSITKPPVSVLAWTTTPWTLPANAALVVDENATYATCLVDGEYLILAEDLIEQVLEGKEYRIEDTYLGKELVGNTYAPLFSYFPAGEKDFRIYAADFVSTSDGTGVIHMAPGFGEDDTALGKTIGLSMHETIDEEGKFIPEVTDYAGIYFKQADPTISAALKERGLLWKEERITHSYPVCYRCSTPLVYKAQDSWYVNIQAVKDQLYKNNENINWIPEHIKHGRFEDAIKTFPDWGISRTRYWATPLPIWECDACDHRDVLGSIAEIEEKSGKKVTNLHRPYIDEHTYSCSECETGMMKRVPEVVDCWLESASMPFAQFHYPFENKEKFEQNFPGDFITEYVGQTRAWFNVMHVVSTILFGTNAFKNVVCTGTINGTDGRKMSKSLGNYPDPRGTIEKHGGDSFRLYIAGSVLPIGEDLNVSEDAIGAPAKEILLPLMNTFKYFTLYANQHGFSYDKTWKPSQLLDTWVLTRATSAILSVQRNLDSYLIPKAIAELKPLIDDISTWYIRRSRDRFVSGDGDALNTLFAVLLLVTKAFAPIIPFITEYLHQELKKALPEDEQKESVHLENFPTVSELTQEEIKLLETMEKTRKIVSLGQSIRVEQGIPLKQPLSSVSYTSENDLGTDYNTLIADELNVQTARFVASLTESDSLKVKQEQQYSVGLDIKITPELAEQGLVREITRAIQAARKQAQLELGQHVTVSLGTEDTTLSSVVEKYQEQLKKATLLTKLTVAQGLSETATYSGDVGPEKTKLSVTIEK